MRVNIYHHEIEFMADRGEPVEKTADTGITFFGFRLPTEPVREHEPGDDDSAAVTLWLPWTRKNGHDTRDVRRIAHRLLVWCDSVDATDA